MSAPWANLQLCPSSQQILATPLSIVYVNCHLCQICLVFTRSIVSQKDSCRDMTQKLLLDFVRQTVAALRKQFSIIHLYSITQRLQYIEAPRCFHVKHVQDLAAVKSKQSDEWESKTDPTRRSPACQRSWCYNLIDQIENRCRDCTLTDILRPIVCPVGLVANDTNISSIFSQISRNYLYRRANNRARSTVEYKLRNKIVTFLASTISRYKYNWKYMAPA